MEVGGETPAIDETVNGETNTDRATPGLGHLEDHALREDETIAMIVGEVAIPEGVAMMAEEGNMIVVDIDFGKTVWVATMIDGNGIEQEGANPLVARKEIAVDHARLR
ncbi:hypothetical protein SpCBS45565_g00346 [Spizellomyces sp. 'palustris']|nr:hypothetical protein SpCBS45565_g00346 [Spizellomyces sp. 'palustris']